MSEPSLALQGALVTLLKGANTDAADRWYDKVPSPVTFPYGRVGDDQVIGDDDDCEELSQVVSRLHIWSQKGGKVEAKTIAGQVRAAIRAATFTLSGFTVDDVQFVQTLYL